MSPFVETGIIFQRELRKNFRSAKGIALAVLTLLGGAGVALLMAKLDAATGHKSGGVPVEMLEVVYGRETAEWLTNAPVILLLLLKVTVGLSPILVALMGFDSVAADIQHRTVRYWTLRSRRASYFVGKWAGLWATVAAVTFMMDLIIWIVCIANRESSVVLEGEATSQRVAFWSAVWPTLSWGLRFWSVSAFLCAIWSAIAVFVSSLFRTPMVALLVTIATFFTLFVASLIFTVMKLDVLAYLYPNQLERLMLDPRASKFAGGILACLAMAGVYVAGGSFFFARRDV